MYPERAEDLDSLSNKELNISRGGGNLDGPDDEWTDADHYMNDGRSLTETTFYYTQDDTDPYHLRDYDRHQLHREPEDRTSWEDLSKKNDGVGTPGRKGRNNDSDARRWAQTFAGQIGLTPYQTERLVYIIDGMMFTDYRPYSAEKIILATLSLVVDVDAYRDLEDFEIGDWIIYQDDFQSLMDDIDMNRDELWSIRRQIRDDYFE